MADIGWEKKGDQAWVTKVLAELERDGQGPEIVLRGECPRCGDSMTATAAIGPVPRAGGVAVEDLRLSAEPRRYVIACNCTGTHKGRPDGECGCGVFGMLEVSG